MIEANKPDYAQPISNNAEFVNITKMPVKEKLFDIGACSSMGRHGNVSSLIRVIVIIKVYSFFVDFKLSDNIGGYFLPLMLRCRRIQNSHGSFGSVNFLADRFCKVNKPFKERL